MGKSVGCVEKVMLYKNIYHQTLYVVKVIVYRVRCRFMGLKVIFLFIVITPKLFISGQSYTIIEFMPN